jgi:hypothetical protein
MNRRRRWPWVLAAGLPVVVACCGIAVVYRNEIGCRLPLVECLDTGGLLYVHNATDERIVITVDSSSIPVEAGQLLPVGDIACGDSPLVATDAQGREVARLAPDPQCNTRTWIFEPDGTARVVFGRASPTP